MSRVNEAERRSVLLLRIRTKISLKVRSVSRICSSNAPLMVMKKWRLVQFFYQGLSQPNLAYKALDELADNSQQWDFMSCQDKSARNPKRVGILELKGELELTQKMDAIVKRLDALSVGKPVNAANTFPIESCFVYASPMYQAQN